MQIKYDKVTRNGKVYFRYRHWDDVLKRRTKTFYASTLKELKEKVKPYINKELAGIVEKEVLFGEFCHHWLFDIHLKDKKPSTATKYDSTYRCYIKDTRISKIKLRELTADDLQQFYNQLFEKHGYNRVKDVHKVISPCIRYAFKAGLIMRNCAELVILPKDHTKTTSNSRVHPLTLQEQMSLIEALKGHPLEALFNMALDTGMRQGELFALTWSDIDFERMNIRINKTYTYVFDVEEKKHKGFVTVPKTAHSSRVIPLPKRVSELLTIHQIRQKEQLLKIGVTQTSETLVFTSVIGQFLDRQNVLKRLKSVYSSIGITGKTFHDLRHTYATRLFELGEAPKTVQELLGHADVNITIGTYTHVLETLKTQAASKIDDLYKSIDQKLESVDCADRTSQKRT